MLSVYKYILNNQETSLEIPKHAKILHVDEQYGEICIWALVDVKNPHETRKFIAVGTGHNVPEKYHDYIGTVLMNLGTLVIHVFENFRERLGDK